VKTAAGLVRVMTLSPHADVRQAVARALEGDAGLLDVGGAADGRDPFRIAAAADVALLDADLVEPAFVEACSALRAHSPGLRILLLANSFANVQVREALDAGAHGVVHTENLPSLAAGIRGAMAGAFWLSRSELHTLLPADPPPDQLAVDGADTDRFAQLTPRERQTLLLLAGGCDHHAIARKLIVSPHTARTHIHNVLKKLGVHSRLEAVALFLQRDGSAARSFDSQVAAS
jgi:DNA-binding NarL/FixJ family response regulator